MKQFANDALRAQLCATLTPREFFEINLSLRNDYGVSLAPPPKLRGYHQHPFINLLGLSVQFGNAWQAHTSGVRGTLYRKLVAL